MSAVEEFYGRWAGLYDVVARYTPGVDAWRERAVDRLALAPGDTVVEMGCGTGANFPYLCERVGPDGRVVGVDLTRPVLDRARSRSARADRGTVRLVRGDAARPPLDGPVDAVLATFVVGMLDDPAAAVDRWLDLLAPAGRLVLLDAVPSARPHTGALNAAFRAFVRLSAPARGRYAEPPAVVLSRRVEAAREALVEGAAESRREEFALGFVQVTDGRAPG